MNDATFIVILLTTCVSIFYFGYLYGREMEKEQQQYAKTVRDNYERNR